MTSAVQGALHSKYFGVPDARKKPRGPSPEGQILHPH